MNVKQRFVIQVNIVLKFLKKCIYRISIASYRNNRPFNKKNCQNHCRKQNGIYILDQSEKNMIFLPPTKTQQTKMSKVPIFVILSIFVTVAVQVGAEGEITFATSF